MGIPADRILVKLDELLGKNDYVAAKRHLQYWLAEAEAMRDNRGVLLLDNELMGLCRKLGEREEALGFALAALNRVEAMGIEENVGAATTFLNAATVYKAFGQAETAIPLFERARRIYEQSLSPLDERLGGLYNNMALALVDVQRLDEAFTLYEKALAVMEKQAEKEPEQAVTYLNMASAAESQGGLEGAHDAIAYYVETAKGLLESGRERTDGNYAFVCEKCASVFGYYGDTAYAEELKKRCGRIYERS